MNGMSGDAVHVHMEIIKLAAERRGPGALSVPKPMAGVIAKRVGWASHGSDSRLNKALQELRAHGKASYVKGTGWVPTGSEASGDSLDEDERGLGALAKTLHAQSTEVTFWMSRPTARLFVKAFWL